MNLRPGRLLGGGVNTIAHTLAVADFRAPLRTSLVPTRGTGAPTFTRATTATVVDHEGVLRTCLSGEARFTGARRVRNLIGTASENFDSADWTKVDTTVVANQAVAPDGTTTADLVYPTTTGTLRYFWRTLTSTSVVNSTVLLQSFYAKAAGMSWIYLGKPGTGSNQGAYFNLSTGEVGTTFSGISGASIEDVGNGWYRCSLVQTDTVDTSAYPIFGLADANNTTTATTSGTNGVFVWGAQLEDITGRADQTTPSEYVSVGVLSAPYHGTGVDGVKCFDTTLAGVPIPTATLKGYLAEGARTNLCLQSEDILTTWETSGSGQAANQYTAPNGTVTMDQITGDNISSLQAIYQSIATSASVATFSFYAKYHNNQWINARISDGTNSFIASFDILNGVAGVLAASTTSTITRISTGVYRCEVRATTLANASGQMLVAQQNSDTATIAIHTTSSTQKTGLWGFQYENAAFASSYIPTTATAVTRNADILTYPDTGNISDTAGTSYVEFSAQGVTGLTQLVLARDTNGRFPYINTFADRTQLYDGTTQNNATAGASFINSTQKSAQNWGAGTKSISYAGTTVVSSAYDGTQGIGAIAIGCSNFGTNNLGGNIADVCIWTRKLPDAILKRISK